MCSFMGNLNILGEWQPKGRIMTIYDLNSNTWEEKADMSVYRIVAQFLVSCRNLVVTGGSIEKLSFPITNKIEVYNYASKAWSTMPCMTKKNALKTHWAAETSFT